MFWICNVSVGVVSQCLEFSVVSVIKVDFYSDRSSGSNDLVMDTDPPGPQLGGGSVTCAAPVGPSTGAAGAATASATVPGQSVTSGIYSAASFSGHGSPGLAAAYMSQPYGVGMLPFTSWPQMSLAPDLMSPQPAIQLCGNVQELLVRRAHLVHALASMVSLLFFLLLYNTLGVEMTHCIALLPTQFRCCDYLSCGRA